MKNRHHNSCDLCPCKLSTQEPSPMALLSVEDIKSGIDVYSKSHPGCRWFINSAEHNFCFWKYAEGLNKPVSDKEICLLLCISPQELKEISSTAMKKLKNAVSKDRALASDLLESLINHNAAHNGEVVNSREVGVILQEVNGYQESEQEEEYGKLKMKSMMPTHRGGKKADLYSLSTKKKK